MEQANSIGLAMLQAIAGQAQMTKSSKVDGEAGDFQKMMEKAQSGQPDNQIEERPKNKLETPAKGDKNQIQKQEDPLETAKRMQVYLVPVSQEELSQYPAEWLPNVEEGEPIFCVGVTTDENGQQVPILVDAEEAYGRFGKEVVAPGAANAFDPKADTMLKATAPGADNSPAAVLEKLSDKEIAQTAQKVMEEIQPEQKDDKQVEITDVEQAPQRIFRDVEMVPMKVGEVYSDQHVDETDVVKQIDTQLMQALQKGESMVRIQLTPENLGIVTVEISQGPDGVLRIALSAHSSETRSLLERHAGDLQGLVSSHTQQTVEVDVQRQQESQQNQNQQNYDGSNGHAQDEQERRRQQQEQSNPEDFMQQLRLGLIPTDGES